MTDRPDVATIQSHSKKLAAIIKDIEGGSRVSEQRDLQADKVTLSHYAKIGPTTGLERIAVHAIDRAITAEANLQLMIRQYTELKEENYRLLTSQTAEKERDELQKQLEHQTKELNRLRILEQGLSDFQNDMFPHDTAKQVYAWIESTTGYKNIYQEKTP